jgi:hypothetical protein
MGSSGISRYSDYPRSAPKKTAEGGASGGASGEDPCDKAFSADLEDFERSEYFARHKSPPKVGLEVAVSLERRLTVRTGANETLGFLPTKFNYLAGCIKSGHNYSGQVSGVSSKPLIRVRVDIAPSG